jgi:hypothetical protein
MKKKMKKLTLVKETLRNIELRHISAGETGSGCWESRGFTNCTYCDGQTKWRTDCTQI